MEHAVANQFFYEVVGHPRLQDYVSDDHFTAHGTLIGTRASLKSFRSKNEPTKPKGPGRRRKQSERRISPREANERDSPKYDRPGSAAL
jgi:hypothetical protein